MLLLGVGIVNNIKLHIQKYFIYDILALILFIGINKLVITFYNDYQNNIHLENDFSYYDSSLDDIYKIDPTIFYFNEDNIAIVEMNDLLKPITNGKDTTYFGEIPMTKEQDQCVGYIIVKKHKNKLNYDYSHICDMLDY